ncbi:amino acid ABC transporter permease [Vibrio sp. S4M6]|uniref:amino acid ABC transporter permease n=1 Tax=Vibrio sinus TaxID=2946865 RepID=UPI00202A794A|nr:amino acid ABC transporter permease [Vibrio sinus]MCL9781997.1 amino acid ABC transporter permease [Vibrio sinus]
MERWINLFNDLLQRKETILISLYKTIELTTVVSITGFVMGLLLFFLFINSNGIVRKVVKSYVSFFVGTPLLIWLFVAYYGLPQQGIHLSANAVAIIGFTLNVGAYNCSYLLSGYNGMEADEITASIVQGFTSFQRFRFIILPQAFIAALPSLTNQVINNLKDSTIVFLIGYSDFFNQIQEVAASNFLFFRTYLVAVAVYFVLICVIIMLSRKLEKKLMITRVMS